MSWFQAQPNNDLGSVALRNLQPYLLGSAITNVLVFPCYQFFFRGADADSEQAGHAD
jgi:hypothetical protein